ncbi:MAG: hypothetical protein KC425_01110 [Anaerolineales bacterium]|nr:hypothetical protein [Anaerolineales bacterium]
MADPNPTLTKSILPTPVFIQTHLDGDWPDYALNKTDIYLPLEQLRE